MDSMLIGIFIGFGISYMTTMFVLLVRGLSK